MESKMKTEEEVLQERKRECMFGILVMILINKFIGMDLMDLGEDVLNDVDKQLIPALDENIANTDTDETLLDTEEDVKDFKEVLTKFMLDITGKE